MKRFTTILLSAIAVASLLQMPAAAQSRGGGSSSSRGSGSTTRSSSSSSSSSMSRQSSARPSYSAPRQSAAPSRSSQPSQQTRSYSSPQRQQSVQTQSRQQYSGQTRQQSSAQTRQQGSSATRQQGNVQSRQQSSAQSRAQSAVQSRQQAQQSSRQQSSRAGGSATQTRSQSASQTRSQAYQPARTGIQTQRGEINPRPAPVRPTVRRIAPRDRRPMMYNAPVCFWHGGHHYYGHRVTYLPSWYVRRVYGGITYYIVDDIYYRYYGGHYYVCRPPVGIYVGSLAADVVLTACTFAYYASVNNTINSNQEVIASQNATIAANNEIIAEQNAQIALNAQRAAASASIADEMGLQQTLASANQEYFYQDGVFYSKDASGQYITIVPPAGALIQELPDDYDVVEMEGKEYYKVDDTIFGTTVVDGKIYFEVIGQFTGELAHKYNLNNKS